MDASVENDNNGAQEVPPNQEKGPSGAGCSAHDAASTAGLAVSLPVLPAHSWWLRVDFAQDTYKNIKNYHTIAKNGALNGRSYNVESVPGIFQHHSDDVAEQDLLAVAAVLLDLKKDYEQYSKDAYKRECIKYAAKIGIIKKNDGFEELLEKLGRLTKADVLEKQYQIDQMCSITRDFVRKTFGQFENNVGLNVQITDKFFGVLSNGEEIKLKKPHKNWSGHSGYTYSQEAMGQVVKEIKNAMANGVAKMTVNKRVKRAADDGNENSNKRARHLPVIVDLTGEASIVVKQAPPRLGNISNSLQTTQVHDIVKKYALSSNVENDMLAVIHGTYGAYLVCDVVKNGSTHTFALISSDTLTRRCRIYF